MNERTAVLLGVIAGAAVGGLAGFVLLTERGRRLRAELAPTMEEMLRSAGAIRDTIERARAAAVEGFRSAGDTRSAWETPPEEERLSL